MKSNCSYYRTKKNDSYPYCVQASRSATWRALLLPTLFMHVVLVDGKLKKHLFFAILLAALFIAK